MYFGRFVVVLILPVLAGCPENDGQYVASSAQSALDAKRAEYDAIYEKQLRDADAQIKKAGEHIERQEALLKSLGGPTEARGNCARQTRRTSKEDRRPHRALGADHRGR